MIQRGMQTRTPPISCLLPDSIPITRSRRAVHGVQFYRDEAFFIDAVRRFALDGLRRDEGVVVLATPSHLKALVNRISSERVDAPSLIKEGRLVLRDVNEILSRFLVNGVPCESLFRATIDEVLENCRRCTAVRVCGEMLDTLWRSGNRSPVLRLEELWSRIAEERNLELLCGYRLDGFADRDHQGAFQNICECHRQVIPSERHFSVGENDELRAIAELEQRAVALEAELEERKRTEAELERKYTSERKSRERVLRLQRELETRKRQADALVRLTRAVNAAACVEEILEPALDAVESLLQLEGASILLFDRGDSVRVHGAREVSDVFRRALETHCPWSPGDVARPLWVPDVEICEPFAGSREVFRGHGIRALGYFPLLQQMRVLGALVIYGGHSRKLSEQEDQMAATISAEVAQAVARAQLISSERDARTRAEQLAARAGALQSITASLSRASGLAEVVEVVVGEGTRVVGATTGGIWLVGSTDGIAELAASSGYSATMAAYQRMSADSHANAPVIDTIRNAEPIWLGGLASFRVAYPEFSRAMGPQPAVAIASLPMTVHARCTGALVFSFDEVRSFPEEERQFLLLFAQYCAQAMERARLFDRERAARNEAEGAHQRTAFLLEASVLLSSSLDFQDTLERLAALTVARICHFCIIEMAEDPGKPLVPIATAHVDPAKVDFAREYRRRFPLDPAEGGISNVLRTTIPALDENTGDRFGPDRAGDLEHLRFLQKAGVRSFMITPIAARGKIFGAITFASAESGRKFTRADVELAELLGRRAGIAVDNARLYDSAQRETRAREEVMAIVSHDLRNPLAAILMDAEYLLRRETAAGACGRVRESAEAIRHSAERMSRLIDDLLDFSSIQGGRLAITMQSSNAIDIVEATAETFRALAGERGLVLECRRPDELPGLRCDRDRVIQALGNLVANALKATPPGGRVTLTVEDRGAEVVFQVVDTGPGIAPENLAKVFERYFRGDRTKYRGTGLGLAISKGIVDAHGGRIWAESNLGAGSRFFIALPKAIGTEREPASGRSTALPST